MSTGLLPTADAMPAYRLLRVLREGPRHRVSLALAEDGEHVVLKQVRSEQAHAGARLRLQREQQMLIAASSAFVPHAIALALDAPEPTLVLGWRGGEPLPTLSDLAPADAIEIAQQAALALLDIHRAGVLHLDLSPHNLLWNAAQRQLTVIDFSSAMLMHGEEAASAARRGGEGTLPFMSPEQAGLMNRPVDNRSDLYSLGITLYRLAAGALPFVAEDALGWAHAHLTALPEPLQHRRPDLPAMFCAVVHRLIAKSPDDRYQTAWGLAHDLARCRDALDGGLGGFAFELGQRDVSDRLNPAPALHGRTSEAEALRSAWQRAADGGAELVLIVGDAGIGKTALVHDLRPAAAARGAVCIEGKFDALGQGVPYSAMVEALGTWVDLRLADDAPSRSRWQASIASALGAEQSALCGLLPRLRALLGTLPELPAADERGSQQRLQRALVALVGVICSAEHPLLWVIDDLQWADAASLALLQALLAAGLPRHLLLVASSRGADPNGLRVQELLQRACADAGTPLQTIALQPLDAAASAALVRDILRAPADAEAELAAEVQARVAGHPFGIASMLGHLRAAGVLRFDADRLRWTWSAPALAALAPSEGMVGLLLQQAARLPTDTGRLLALGACVGREFGLAQIARLAREMDEREADAEALDAVQAALQPACAAQFLVQRVADEGVTESAGQGIVYRFVHDQVQEMAHGLLDETQRRVAHGRIGAAMLAAGAAQDALLTAVNHLNLGPAGDADAREALAALNLRAMEDTRHRGAIAAALVYAEAGLALAPSTPALRHTLRLVAHRLAIHQSRWSEARGHYEALCADRPPLLGMAQATCTQIFRLVASEPYEQAVRIGLECLADMGVAVDLDIDEAHLRARYAEYCEAWAAGAYARLLHSPPESDPFGVAATHLLSALAYAYDPEPRRAIAVALQTMRGVLRHGLPAVRWEMYEHSVKLHVELGDDFRAAFDEWPFWLEGLTRSGVPRTTVAQVWTSHASHVLPWSRPLADSLSALRHAAESNHQGRHLGSIASDFQISCATRFESGEPLSRYDDEAALGLAAAARVKNPDLSAGAEVFRQVSRVLQGTTRARWVWDDADFSLEAVFAANDDDDATGPAYYWLFELQLAVLSNRPGPALRAVAECAPRLDDISARVLVASHRYYAAVAEAMQPAPDRAAIESALRRLERWAEGAPTTFAAKTMLVRAELQRIDGDSGAALGSYEQAIALAQDQACLQGVALAALRLAGMCFGLGWQAAGQGALARARSACEAWGARALLDALDDEFGARPSPPPADAERWAHTNATSTGSGSLEFEAMLKAAHSITSELDQDRLPTTLIHTLMQYAGADHAVLLMAAGDRLEVSARAHARGDSALAAPGEADAQIAWSALRYARQTGETLLLDDPQRDARFQDDPYLCSVRPQSLLCLPVRKLGDELLGMIYLENRATAHAFSHERLRVLHILVGHVIGALDNARLVHDLRESRDSLELKVQQRTRELELARQVAEDATRAKGDFLANMSHEIRTPMNAILGMTHLALNSGLDARQHNFVSKAERAAQSLLGLINDILDFSKVEAGKLDMESVPFALAPLLDELVDLIGPKARDKGLALRLGLPPEVPAVLVGDPLRLRQVLVNLASNAVKFTEAGEVAVRVKLAEGPTGQRETMLRFEVEDSGVGMSEAQRASLFQPFVQADSSIARRYGGTGLGLAISRNLVALMGGEIGVTSRPGLGSVFSFSARFGLPDATLGVAELRTDASAGASSVSLQGKRILLVEDNEINQELALELLRSQGLVVTLAEHGKAALAALDTQAFDVVLMDCQMPVMDGYEATRAIRAQPRWRTLPIIAMTANAMAGDRDKALAAGMNDHIAKPIDVAAMFETLGRWVRVGAVEAHNAPAGDTQATADRSESGLDRTGLDVADQFALPGFDLPSGSPTRSKPRAKRPPEGQHTLFFAIFPDADAALRLAECGARLCDAQGVNGTRLEATRLHVTLHALGGFGLAPPPDIVDAARQAAAASVTPPFDIVFDRALRFSGGSGSNAVVLCSSDGALALAAFRQRLGLAMANAGLPVSRSFTPHMTVAYARQSVAEHAIEPVRWTAGEMALVYSHVGRHVYEVLDRWPFRG